MTLHNNEVGVVFAEHTRVVVFFVEVDEHEYMSILLVTHDVIVDFDELFWTHLTRHLLSYEIQFIFVLGSPQRHVGSVSSHGSRQTAPRGCIVLTSYEQTNTYRSLVTFKTSNMPRACTQV